MKESTSKEKVLKKVRNALIHKVDNPFVNIDFNSPVFPKQTEEPEVEFAQNFIENSGTFIYCENEKDVIDQLTALVKKEEWNDIYCNDTQISLLLDTTEIPYKNTEDEIKELQVGITPCDFMISRFGSVMVSSSMGSGRRLPFYAETHIVIAKASQVVRELNDALSGMRIKYSENFPSQITNIMGPSRTADIEKTLVMGAHGPRNMILFMIDDK